MYVHTHMYLSIILSMLVCLSTLSVSIYLSVKLSFSWLHWIAYCLFFACLFFFKCLCVCQTLCIYIKKKTQSKRKENQMSLWNKCSKECCHIGRASGFRKSSDLLEWYAWMVGCSRGKDFLKFTNKFSPRQYKKIPQFMIS